MKTKQLVRVCERMGVGNLMAGVTLQCRCPILWENQGQAGKGKFGKLAKRDKREEGELFDRSPTINKQESITRGIASVL